MSKLIWSAMTLASLKLFSIEPVFISLKPVNLSIAMIPQYQSISWTEKFEQKRKETEFLDDETEKLLNQNKKWLILMCILFLWMIYKSLWSSK